MKVIFEFGDEDHHDLIIFQQAPNMYSALFDIQEEFRKWVKYNERNFTGDQLDAIDKFSERFYEILQENKVHIE